MSESDSDSDDDNIKNMKNYIKVYKKMKSERKANRKMFKEGGGFGFKMTDEQLKTAHYNLNNYGSSLEEPFLFPFTAPYKPPKEEQERIDKAHEASLKSFMADMRLYGSATSPAYREHLKQLKKENEEYFENLRQQKNNLST
jgi:hypothetical protein